MNFIWRGGVSWRLFALFAGLEALVPRRARALPRTRRWLTNLAITVLNTLALRALAVVLPLLAVGAAVDAGAQGWGLFNRLDWPLWVELVLAVLVLDLRDLGAASGHPQGAAVLAVSPGPPCRPRHGRDDGACGFIRWRFWPRWG